MLLSAGWAVSGFYGYLKGVNNELALKHIPQVPPRNDTLAGPYGRRSDQASARTSAQRACEQEYTDTPCGSVIMAMNATIQHHSLCRLQKQAAQKGLQ